MGVFSLLNRELAAFDYNNNETYPSQIEEKVSITELLYFYFSINPVRIPVSSDRVATHIN